MHEPIAPAEPEAEIPAEPIALSIEESPVVPEPEPELNLGPEPPAITTTHTDLIPEVIDDVIEETHGNLAHFGKVVVVHFAIFYKCGQVERSEIANAPRRKTLLSAWINAADILIIPGIRYLIVPIHENHSWLR